MINRTPYSRSEGLRRQVGMATIGYVLLALVSIVVGAEPAFAQAQLALNGVAPRQRLLSRLDQRSPSPSPTVLAMPLIGSASTPLVPVTIPTTTGVS